MVRLVFTDVSSWIACPGMFKSVCVALALSFAFASLAHAQQSLPNSGTCTKLTSELPQRMWETAATFDPETGELVHHGGHVTYAQSSYTYLYHPDNGTIRRAKPRRTPPRVCLQDGTYAESRKVSVFAHGRSAHGSMPPGEFKDGIYTALKNADET